MAGYEMGVQKMDPEWQLAAYNLWQALTLLG